MSSLSVAVVTVTCYGFSKRVEIKLLEYYSTRNIIDDKVIFILIYTRTDFIEPKNSLHCCIFKMPVDQIQYSGKYNDDKYEYRHVILPADLARHVPKTHLMSETEWRNLGVQQSPGWVHYMMHVPEPHVLLFRRPRTDVLTTSRNSSFQRDYENHVFEIEIKFKY